MPMFKVKCGCLCSRPGCERADPFIQKRVGIEPSFILVCVESVAWISLPATQQYAKSNYSNEPNVVIWSWWHSSFTQISSFGRKSINREIQTLIFHAYALSLRWTLWFGLHVAMHLMKIFSFTDIFLLNSVDKSLWFVRVELFYVAKVFWVFLGSYMMLCVWRTQHEVIFMSLKLWTDKMSI